MKSFSHWLEMPSGPPKVAEGSEKRMMKGKKRRNLLHKCNSAAWLHVVLTSPTTGARVKPCETPSQEVFRTALKTPTEQN